jgi:Mg2+ and Co2+ transporter CorA
MFRSRYYLMVLVALFYRATMLDYEERTALVSKRLYRDQEDGKQSPENILLANNLRAEFLHFSNYWYFDELANKVEEIEHFMMQCREYRIEPMKRQIEEEVEKLKAWLDNYYQYRNTEAVNRLAMLSLIVGGGAVLTGFFGMNFGAEFERLFFQPDAVSRPVHLTAVILVTLLALGALLFGFYVIATNWSDYRDSLVPRKWKRAPDQPGSLKQ